ncbi:MAG: ribosome small subunit-dependent GTPase A [Mangrovibacterium sp.]
MNKGLVVKSTGSWYSVKEESGAIIPCKIKGTFRMKGIRTTNPITVGDRVEFILKKDENEVLGLINKIEERKNYIIRKSTNLSKQAHIIAANIDCAFLVVTLAQPVTSLAFIDRFLASAEAYRISCTLIFNKVDLYHEEQKDYLESVINLYERIGYTCLKTSTKTGEGLEQLKEMMRNKISVFSGHSGVGKSTLVNQIEPGLTLKTNEISEYHETGQHTTTFSEMFLLSFGGYIIDTPGIKGFGVVEMDRYELSHYFPEIFKLSGDCQFNNCTHTHEPNCAIKQAVYEGEIAESRYYTYLSLVEDEDEKYRS